MAAATAVRRVRFDSAARASRVDYQSRYDGVGISNDDDLA